MDELSTIVAESLEIIEKAHVLRNETNALIEKKAISQEDLDARTDQLMEYTHQLNACSLRLASLNKQTVQ